MKLIITLVLAASMVLMACAIDSRGQVTADPPAQTFDPLGTGR